jgi:hypothetical protein
VFRKIRRQSLSTDVDSPDNQDIGIKAAEEKNSRRPKERPTEMLSDERVKAPRGMATRA